jgi:type VI secretion system FHA domain protein
MHLVLRTLTWNEQPMSQAIVGCFDHKGGTIGRSDTNTMTLPDPQRHISRLQAEVISHEGEFHLRNAASANAIFINGRALGPGEHAVLASHDELRIGGYVLSVLMEADIEVVRTITQDRPVTDARAVIAKSAVEHRTDPRQMAQGRDPNAAALSQPPLPPLPPLSPFSPPSATPPGASMVDLPLDTPSATPSNPAAPSAPSVDELFAGLGLGGSGGTSVGGRLADALGAEPAAMPAPAPTPPPPPPPRTAARRPEPEHPATRPAIRSLAAPIPATTADAAAAADPLWAAFCEGAGIRVGLAQGLNPEQMRVIGELLREATEGALRLMAVRATAKTELRAAVTTIRARNNNPLKFSPNAQAALEQLLQPPLRGFMAGPLAMQDVMHDLVGHSIGTMAGMRAALAGVLARFEPGELEHKLVGKSVIDSLLPMNRKAKLWDLYLQHFGAIRDDAQDDFHNLFGAAFVAAYEDQLDRLASPGTPGDSTGRS